MNAGTKVNEILKGQGFDHHDYENVRLWSVPTGLKMQVATVFYYVETEGHGMYTITKGLHHDEVLATEVSEIDLAETLEKILT